MYVKKIFSQLLLYGIGSSFTSLVSYLILPVYTKLLSLQDFGKISLVLTMIFLLQYIYNGGIYVGFMIRYFDFKTEDHASRKKLCSTILFFYLFFSLIASLFIYMFLGHTIMFFTGTQGKLVVLLIVLISSCEILFILPTSIMRFEERIVTFISINFMKSFVFLAAVFCALRFTKGGINAALLAQLAVAFCAVVVAYLLTYRNYAFIFDINEFKKSAKIGLPFLIAMLNFWIIDSASKFMVKNFLSLTDVGLYAIGFKIGQAILFTVTVFQLVWQPMMFRIASEEDAQKIFGRIFNYYILVIFTIALAVSLFSRQLILMFSTKTYTSSSSLVPIIVFAYAFYGLFYYFQTPLIIKKRTLLLMLICVAATVFNIVANFIAIPLFGITGAAYATNITYFMMACAVFMVSRKIFHISYNFSKLLKIAFAILLVFVFRQIGESRNFSGVLFGVTLMSLFVITLLSVKFLDESDILFLKEKVRSFYRQKA